MTSINTEDRYIFNPKYILKNDIKRFELVNKENHLLFMDPEDTTPTDDIQMPLHPLIALLLYLFNGRNTLKEVVTEYSHITGYPKEQTEKFAIELLKVSLNRGKERLLKFDEYVFYLPKNLLFKNSDDTVRENDLRVEEFMIPKNQLDLESFRSYLPTSFILEVNFRCFTDCVYCYANRDHIRDSTIPLERLKELIQDAKRLRLNSIGLSGGEVFLYENWEALLKELVDNGFIPYISTKIPIAENIIRKLKEIGIPGIQFSIDTLDKEKQKKMLLVSGNYRESLINSLKLMRKYDLKFAVNSQICSINQEVSEVKEFLDFLLTFENLRSIKVGPIARSLYKSEKNFQEYKPSLAKIDEISKLVSSYGEKYKPIAISMSGYSTVKDFQRKPEEKEKSFADRARCSGNFYFFVVLPDGQVTVCEELYFHPRFIIGNLQNQSIEEVWNSEKALGLYKLSKDMVGEGSVCKTCEKFEYCHQRKGVCWKYVLGAYGMDKWDYPDPRCPIAPKPERRCWLE